MDASWRWYQNDEAGQICRLLEHVERFPSVVIKGSDGSPPRVGWAVEDDVIAKVKEVRGENTREFGVALHLGDCLEVPRRLGGVDADCDRPALRSRSWANKGSRRSQR